MTMRVFHIKGVSGLFMFFLAILAVIGLVVLLPTSFIMVLWNATVFEGLYGPEIHMGHALLLWAAGMIMVFLVMRPQISFNFKKVTGPSDLDRTLRGLKKPDSSEE
jgi:hypothetical protein